MVTIVYHDRTRSIGIVMTTMAVASRMVESINIRVSTTAPIATNMTFYATRTIK